MDNTATFAVVQQAEETERHLIDRAIASLSLSNWEVGECAAKWTQKYARGRTDEDFGKMIDLPGSQVQQRRQTWETFADVRDDYPKLKWSHFYTACSWDDAAECLAWAEDNHASVAQLRAWRRMNNGEDLTQPENDHFSDPGIPDNSHTYVKFDGDDDLQTDGQQEGFESAASEHVADADPYQKPPSTVVSTPRDFPEKAEKTAKQGETPHVDVMDILDEFRELVARLDGHVESGALVAVLRRLADEIEGAK